jgi:hypothetical protein
MSRQLTNLQQTALARDAIVSFVLIEIGLPTPVGGLNAVYLTDAPFDIDVLSATAPDRGAGPNTYQAQGDFIGINETSENSDLKITSINIILSALNSDNISTYAKTEMINQTVSINRVLWDQATESIVSDSGLDYPIIIFKGRISGYSIQNAEDSAELSLQVDSQFTNFDKINCRRTNQTNFQREFPTDFSMQYSHETLNDVRWGKK